MKKTITWLVHLGYWGLFLLLLVTFYFFAVFVPLHIRSAGALHYDLLSWLKLMAVVILAPGILTFYGCYAYLFEKFLSRRRFMSFAGCSLLAALLASLATAAIATIPAFYGRDFLFADGRSSACWAIVLMTLIACLSGVMGTLIKGCLTWYSEIRLKENLHRRNVETELALVKSKIDPHFLFNTLHNIDILITRDPERASAYLNKLSGIMRFLLYETKAPRISLEHELEYLQQYIDLQKIRTSNPDYIDFAVTGRYTGQIIAPMLLLPFVENAFKHTESHKATSRISVLLQLAEKKIIFNCSNDLYFSDSTGGLGDRLIRKRLELLYPGKHTLSVGTNDGQYRVELELNL